MSPNTGIEGLMSISEQGNVNQGGSSSQNRMGYHRNVEGENEIVFLSEINGSEEFPPAAFFRGYKVRIPKRDGSGDIFPTIAYIEGDELHPNWIESCENDNKDPYRSMTNFMLAIVFNKTAYDAFQVEDEDDLTPAQSIYRETLSSDMDLTAPVIYEAGNQIVKGIRQYVDNRQEKGINNPGLMDWVFKVTKQKTGDRPRDVSYTISATYKATKLPEDVKKIMQNALEREEFVAPKDLMDRKRYVPRQEAVKESTSNGNGSNGNGVPKQYSISSLAEEQDDDDDGNNW